MIQCRNPRVLKHWSDFTKYRTSRENPEKTSLRAIDVTVLSCENNNNNYKDEIASCQTKKISVLGSRSAIGGNIKERLVVIFRNHAVYCAQSVVKWVCGQGRVDGTRRRDWELSYRAIYITARHHCWFAEWQIKNLSDIYLPTKETCGPHVITRHSEKAPWKQQSSSRPSLSRDHSPHWSFERY